MCLRGAVFMPQMVQEGIITIQKQKTVTFWWQNWVHAHVSLLTILLLSAGNCVPAGSNCFHHTTMGPFTTRSSPSWSLPNLRDIVPFASRTSVAISVTRWQRSRRMTFMLWVNLWWATCSWRRALLAGKVFQFLCGQGKGCNTLLCSPFASVSFLIEGV